MKRKLALTVMGLNITALVVACAVWLVVMAWGYTTASDAPLIQTCLLIFCILLSGVMFNIARKQKHKRAVARLGWTAVFLAVSFSLYLLITSGWAVFVWAPVSTAVSAAILYWFAFSLQEETLVIDYEDEAALPA
jgi:peptidoglycan/LPS O-acetylase OafA/YrhL